MAFERFKKEKPGRNCPTISIHACGRLYMNHIASERYFKNCSYVELYYDESNRALGIKPIKRPEHNSFKTWRNKGACAAFIYARNFFQHYDIPFKKSRKYLCFWNEKEKLVEVPLQNRES